MSILEQLKNKGQRLLAEVEAKQVLAEAGVPVNRTYLAGSQGKRRCHWLLSWDFRWY